MEDRWEFDDYDECDQPQCPHCMGLMEVDCHCGGDLCVCENWGYMPCPVCHGDGFVSEERYERYEENMRKQAALMRSAWPEDKP